MTTLIEITDPELIEAPEVPNNKMVRFFVWLLSFLPKFKFPKKKDNA